MKKPNLMISGIILTGASFASRLLGMVLRVWISNRMGAEGMGLYQLVFSLYSLSSTIAVSGTMIAVSRLVAEELAKGRPENATRTLRVSIGFTLVLGTLVSLFLYTQAGWLGASFLKDSRTTVAIRILAPCFPFISVSSCLKGYYYAKRHVLKPATSQIFEQLTRMAVIFFIMGAWAPKGVEYACGAAILGITIGEFTSCGYCIALYYAERRPKTRNRADHMLLPILKISIPVAFKNYINSGFHMIENIMIPGSFQKSGMSLSRSMETYGMLKGMVMPLLMFPTSIIQSFTTVMMPEIAGANATGHKKRVSYAISRILHFTMLLSILLVCIFMSFSYELGTLIYKSQEVGQMLRLLSFVSPFMYLEMVVVSILNGIGEQNRSLLYSMADSVVRLSLIYFLIPVQGMTGFLIVIIVSNLLTSLLNLRRLLKVTYLTFDLRNWAIKPVAAALISGFGLHWLHAAGFIPSIIIALLLLCVAYLALLLISRALTGEDVKWIGSMIRGKNT